MTSTQEPAPEAGAARPDSGVGIFEAHYAGAPGAGWEIGRPQPAFVELARQGSFTGRVLDVGCGSGDNALMTAELGLRTVGVDAAPSGIALARSKAAERGMSVDFLVWDALELGALGERFDTMLDCGLFHCFAPEDRPALVRSLGAALRPGGRYFLMCFSDLQPGSWGPHRVSERELRASFADGWRIDSLVRSHIAVAFAPGTAHAWLAVLTRR
ncbi:class I SAM-dependent methyltransferase [Streptomyces sp. NPDC048191]|uniref:class I SAM-dependent methyltransferase n=1 Tax=Streptomyces sp. NPDC048191 TaxID=3155484 RepID=UPI0033EDED59